MNKLATFILWPTISGVVFSLSLLLFPPLINQLPTFIPAKQSLDEFSQALRDPSSSYRDSITRSAPAVVSINSPQVEFTLQPRKTANPFITTIDIDVDKSNNLGSGVIVSPDGYIITSLHIFSTAYETSTVTLNDQRDMEARMVAVDERNDLALLKVDAVDLPFLSQGRLKTLEVGDVALAIGNPRNVGQSASLGIISALLKREETFVIQTDAAINPGNSGGALIDANGNLIGINSVIVSESGGSEGIGFATPADKAIKLMEAYIESGPSGYLGVESELISYRYGGVVIEGLKIIHISENSPADRAGIREDDVVIGVNNTFVSDDLIEFIRVLSTYAPGDTVIIEVLRGSEILQVPTTLGVGEPFIYPFLYSDEPEFETQIIN